MTFEQCHENLTAIRRRQGTDRPLIRVNFGGTAYCGRLARTDSDPEVRRSKSTPFGVLVLEDAGLARCPETILQIASIPPDGIREIQAN
jgi:hypothetical protein